MEKFGLSHPLAPVTQGPSGGESGEVTRQEPTGKFSLVSLARPLPSSPPPFHTHPALPLTTATVCTCSNSHGAGTGPSRPGREQGGQPTSPFSGSLGGTGVPDKDHGGCGDRVARLSK